MNILDNQFRELQDKYKNCSIVINKDRSKTVTINNIKLPKGWSKNKTHISFDILECYPFCNPIHFRADLDLRLKNGARPRNTDERDTKFRKADGITFLWRPSRWNPNRDTLLTYVHVIEQRFKHIE